MKCIVAVAGSASLLLSGAAHAVYTSLSTTSINTTVTFTADPSPTAVTIHRVWANFTNPSDRLFVWGGGGGLGPSVMNNLNAAGSGPGSGFLNDASGGILPPQNSAAVSGRDTFFTISVTLLQQVPVGRALLTIPGTPPGLTGTSIDLSSGGGVTTTPEQPPNSLSFAGFTGDGDTQLRVLLTAIDQALKSATKYSALGWHKKEVLTHEDLSSRRDVQQDRRRQHEAEAPDADTDG